MDDDTYNYLKKEILEKYVKTNGDFNIKKMSQNFKNMIVEQTNFLSPDETWSNRCRFIVKNIKEPILCKWCGNLFPQKKLENSQFKTYCSLKCANSDHETRLMKMQETCNQRYGVKNPMHVENFRSKCTESSKKSVMEKYGVSNIFQTQETKDKIKKTYLENYGVDHPMKSTEIQEKQKNKIYKKYGVENISHEHLSPESLCILQSPEKLKTIFNEKGLYDSMNLLGISEMTIRKYLKDHEIISAHQNSYETYISNHLESLGISHKKNDRTLIKPKEIDILVEDYKLAIEINGEMWHSEKYNRGEKYHLKKLLELTDKGYTLLQFWTTDINNNPDTVKDMINHKLNKTENKIYARNTKVQKLTTEQYREFCEKNHIQGYAAASYKIGLFQSETLVAVMSFSKPRFSNTAEWELVRYCSKNNFLITGGASKLFSYFVKEVNPTSILSYASNSYSSGNLYKILGFTYSHMSKPGYFYVKANKTLSRVKCQKHKLKKLLDNFDPNLSEKQNMKMNGFYRAWDSGNSVWIWKASE